MSKIVYYGLGWIKFLAGDYSLWVISAVIAVIYVALVSWCAKFPDLHLDAPVRQ